MHMSTPRGEGFFVRVSRKTGWLQPIFLGSRWCRRASSGSGERPTCRQYGALPARGSRATDNICFMFRPCAIGQNKAVQLNSYAPAVDI